MTIAVLESETRNPKKYCLCEPDPVEEVQDQGGNKNGGADLECPADHDNPPCPEQAFEGELQAYSKKQKDEADLANGLDSGLVADNRERVGAGEHPDNQKADNARDLEPLP